MKLKKIFLVLFSVFSLTLLSVLVGKVRAVSTPLKSNFLKDDPTAQAISLGTNYTIQENSLVRTSPTGDQKMFSASFEFKLITLSKSWGTPAFITNYQGRS